MLHLIQNTDPERKLKPAEKNKLVEALVEMASEEHNRQVAAAQVQIKSAQQKWEEAIGATEIQEQIKRRCAEINELQTQLLENACEPVDTGERITSHYHYGRRDREAALNLKGDKLKKYKEHQDKIKRLEECGSRDYQRHVKVSAILGVETVGEALQFIDEVAPRLLDVKPVVAIETEGAA